MADTVSDWRSPGGWGRDYLPTLVFNFSNSHSVAELVMSEIVVLSAFIEQNHWLAS